jgi:uncharacterized membrane protein YdjX (TVP38/TMEM64 family)
VQLDGELDAPAPAASSRRRTLVKILVSTAAAALCLMLARESGVYVDEFARWVDGLGFWGPLVFIAGYVVATVAVMPAFLLTLAAGALFGLGLGVLYVFVAAVLGSSAAFLLARYVARGVVEERLAAHARFAAIDRAVSEQGRKIVFLLRLSPVVPFTLLNYTLGLTRVDFVDYVIGSIGMLPVTALYVYYGKLAGDVAVLAAGGAAIPRGAGYYALMASGLVATLIATALLTRTARRALREAAQL